MVKFPEQQIIQIAKFALNKKIKIREKNITIIGICRIYHFLQPERKQTEYESIFRSLQHSF